jgi:hypothetical protein
MRHVFLQCPCSILSNTNPIWTDPSANPGLTDERPTTNRLSHDTAFKFGYFAVELQVSAYKHIASALVLCFNTD